MDDSTTPDTPAMTAMATPPSPLSSGWVKFVVAALAFAAFSWTLIYLWFAVTGNWLSRAPTQRFSGAQMKITRGAGASDGSHFIVSATDATGIAVITIDTPTVDAADYRRIRWRVLSVDPEAALITAWRSTSAPGKTLSAPLEMYGDDRYVVHPQPPDWSGRIGSIALTIRGTLRQPLFIEDVTIEPADARNIASDRVSDWFGFRYWNGLSINSAIGGPLDQPVWLPVAVAIIALTAIATILARGRKRMPRSAQRAAVAAILVISWLLLDARWLWLRWQQTEVTASTFAGKSPREKHLVDVDGYLYAFAEQVIARLPKTPVRIYIGSDDQYFGGRIAYHLLPHNAFVRRPIAVLPPPSDIKPDEYIVVFRRRAVQYDPANQMLSWDGQAPVKVEVLIAHQGNAAFRVR